MLNTFRRCHSMVRGLRNSRAPISGFDRPSRANNATCRSCAVRSSRVSCVRLRNLLARRPKLSARALQQTIPSRLRQACRKPSAAAHERPPGASRGVTTRRRAGARGRGRGEEGFCGKPFDRFANAATRQRSAPSLSSARQRASRAEGDVGAAGLGRLGQPFERVACELGVATARGLGPRPARVATTWTPAGSPGHGGYAGPPPPASYRPRPL